MTDVSQLTDVNKRAREVEQDPDILLLALLVLLDIRTALGTLVRFQTGGAAPWEQPEHERVLEQRRREAADTDKPPTYD